jgi:pyrrolysine biosynthesis protein PylC
VRGEDVIGGQGLRLCIVGGALQGTEATYLGHEAGIETVVVDRWQSAPALSLADEPHVLDVVKEPVAALRLFDSCDAVIPTNEDRETLTFLGKLFRRTSVPLIHDFKAYETSSSKVRSNQFLDGLGISMPTPWPECGYPVVVKPSGESGSAGVSRVDWPDQMPAAISRARDQDGDYVIQEFLEGPNVSIEVVSDGVEPISLVTTEVVLDENYDCKMVVSPFQDGSFDFKGFEEIGRKIALGLNLRGIMDVEAIVSDGVTKVLEIDARMPSQTPSAVYQSSGLNIIRMLTDIFVRGRSPSSVPPKTRVSTYEHLIFDHGLLYSIGEGAIIGKNGTGRLDIISDWCGFDQVITDYQPNSQRWVATAMCTGHDFKAVQRKRMAALNRLMSKCGAREHVDSAPAKVFA